MKMIDLDARNWVKPIDCYEAIGLALGSPGRHGKNINALIDSVVYGGINLVEPPFVIRIYNIRSTPQLVKQELQMIKEQIALARNARLRSTGYDSDVSLELFE